MEAAGDDWPHPPGGTCHPARCAHTPCWKRLQGGEERVSAQSRGNSDSDSETRVRAIDASSETRAVSLGADSHG